MTASRPCAAPAEDGRCCLPHWQEKDQPERARPVGPDVEICGDADCAAVAWVRGLCQKHYRALRDSNAPEVDYPVRIGVVHDLSEQEVAELRRRVEADALPLFIIAMNWCATQAVVKALETDRRVS